MYKGSSKFFASFPGDWRSSIALFATLFRFSKSDLETMDGDDLIFWKKQSEAVIKAMEKGKR